MIITIPPAMSSAGPPDWPGATWVGMLDQAVILEATASTELRLTGSAGYGTARLLLRVDRRVRGFIEFPVQDGRVLAAGLRDRVHRLAPAQPLDMPPTLPGFTVVICTRDRAGQLRGALTSVLALDYPHLDVLVIDNAPSDTQTRDLVEREFDDPRLSIVEEPVPGLSHARNAGLRHARRPFVAFTDDDVVVDPWWLRALAAGFARGDDVDCVSGLVPSGELRTAVQAYFDARVSWSRNLAVRRFSLADPPADLPMFPFSVGEFGTGANFALRRTNALAMGGFDTAFGVGTRTGGGEDLDMFTRVLFAGRSLVVEPSAIVWHRHRADLGALRHQARGYGIGLGAWLSKIALQPRTALMAIRRSRTAVPRLLGKNGAPTTTPSLAAVDDTAAELGRAIARVGWYETVSVAHGPWAYLRQRWSGEGLLPVPLRTPTAQAEPTPRPVAS
jgi:GT2 family glycosyltransferase